MGLTACIAAPSASAQDAAPTATSQLTEEVTTRLVQIQVDVTGEDRCGLGPSDFEVEIQGRRVEKIFVDDLCRKPCRETVVGELPKAGPRAAAPPGGSPPSEGPDAPTALGTAWFYFDQPLMTFAGRERAFGVARRLASEFLAEGFAVGLLSGAAGLNVVTSPTTDPDAVSRALDALRRDKKQWSTYAQAEVDRIYELGRVSELMSDWGLRAEALRLRDEERRIVESSFARLRVALSFLEDRRPPRILVYFSDILRLNPGSHYLDVFGVRSIEAKQTLARDRFEALYDSHKIFQEFFRDANALGIRVFTVQAQGITAPEVFLGRVTKPDYVISDVRMRQAREALQVVAKETGGEAFLGGLSAKRMLARLRARLSCTYLISFPAKGLPVDQRLHPRVRVLRPGVRIRGVTDAVVRSPEEEAVSRLLAAYLLPGLTRSEVPVRGAVFPLGFEKGRYRALLQVRVPVEGGGVGPWDLGGTLVVGGGVRGTMSAQLGLRGGGTVVAVEREVRFRPRGFELVAVAQDRSEGAVGAFQASGAWPDPRQGGVHVLGPFVAVVRAGGFRREGAETVRRAGRVFLAEGEAVRPGEELEIWTWVCGGKEAKGAPRVVERRIEGVEGGGFEPLELEPGDAWCSSIRDVVPGGALGPGLHRFRVEVLRGGKTEASVERALQVAAGAPPSPGAPSSPTGGRR